jgi:pSer/pThr/pTyr-binding forkhead associated (FHA) protein
LYEEFTLNSNALKLFREACGADEPLVLEIAGPGLPEATRSYFDVPYAVVGRHRGCDPRLEDSQVRTRHYYLQTIGGRVFALDLSSSSGLGRWLAPSDLLAVGTCSLRLVSAGNPASEPIEQWNPMESGSAGRTFLPAVSLEFLSYPQSRQWAVNRVLTLVGGQLPCKVRLDSRSVSPVHCALLLTRQGLWIVNLLGRNGIAVNGRPVRWALLQDGARLQIGRFPIRVSYEKISCPKTYSSDPDVLELDEHPYAPEPLSVATRVNCQAPICSQGPDLPTLLPSPLSHALAAISECLQQQMLAQFQQSMVMMAQMLTSMHRDQLNLLNEALNRVRGMDRQIQDLRNKLCESTVASESSLNNGPVESKSRPTNEDDFASLPEMKSLSTECPVSPAQSPEAKADPPDYHTWLNRRMQALHKERQSLLQKIMSAVVGE